MITELKPGPCAGAFLVAKHQVAQTKAGKNYWRMTLMDRSGTIDAVMWDIPKGVEIRVDDFITVVRGAAEEYNGMLQITVSELALLDPAQVQIEDFILHSKRPAEEMFHELRANIEDSVFDVQIRTFLLEVIDHPQIKPALLKSPAAMKMHQAYRGGLIEHILSLCNAAFRLCGHYKQVDLDVVLAGCVLHDIGKIQELSAELSIQYTPVGKLVGHILIGTRMIWNLAAKAKVPDAMQLQILHIIASHHGEFGDIKPQTREAVLFHYLDNLDAKMSAIDAALEADTVSDRVNVPALKAEVFRW